MENETKEEKKYSGILALRIPPWLHEAVAKEAARRDMSFNEFVLYTLAVKGLKGAEQG